MSTVYKLGAARFAFAAITFIFIAVCFVSLVAEAANSRSADFNASSSQYFSKVSPAGLPTGSLPRTTEAWIKTTATNEQAVLEYGTDADLYHEWLIEVSEDQIGIRLNGANTFWTADNITDGNWHHIAFVYSGSGTLNANTVAYMDGVALSQVSSVAATPDTTSNWIYVGGAGTPVGRFFEGQIDDVRVWNVVRTASEISADKSVELSGNEPGLVGYWKLNGSLIDSTANHNDLTNNNGASFSSDMPFSDAPPPPPATSALKVRKSANESVSKSSTLQNDDELKLALAPNTTYIVDGALLATVQNSSPDLKISFSAPVGSSVAIGYLSEDGSGVLGQNAVSQKIKLDEEPLPIFVKGTVKTGATGGVLQLKWAQFNAKQQSTSVQQGSYLRADAI